ncbi:MAG: hypothetical protein RML95_11290 [Anaerolineae bacterium]|nr:hypothetical protein [Anaerolineae bacterium]MDW8299907.1 hypothetical protein [Anaerolineae bacterium]
MVKREMSLSGLALLAVTALIVLSVPTTAQSGFLSTATPPPSPTNNGGNAQWTILSNTFTSNFPKGFTFTLEATSTGGKIVSAAVLWRHSPVSSRTRRLATIDESGTKMVAVWEKSPGDAVPQWAGVEYWWLLQDESGNVYETQRWYDEYADNTRKWSRMESDDIIVFWQEGVPDQVGPLTIAAMKRLRPFFELNWAMPLGYKPRAIIYADFETWAEWSPGRGTVGGGLVVVGSTNQSWGATAQVYDPFVQPVEEVANDTVPHEIAHLYQYANGGTSGATWFIEGSATFFELNSGPRIEQRVRRWAREGRLPTLQGTGPGGREAYDVGYMFWVWLTETYGADAHRRTWELVRAGRTQRAALEAITKKSFIEMETEFRTWLGAANPQVPTPLPTLPLFLPPTPTYEPTPRR